MIAKDYLILAPEGMHARPATALLRLSRKYKSVIRLKKGADTIQINSMLNILSLSIKCGDTISVSVEGDDEIGAAEALDIFFNEQLKEL